MLFLNIYVAFCLLTFVLIETQSYVIEKELKRKYPDVVKEFIEKNKTNILEKIFKQMRILISCFVPIINIGIFYASLFMLEEIKEKTLIEITKDIKEGF